MIGALINKFEKSNQTVKTFNEIFDCCVLDNNFPEEGIITIGDILGPDTTRLVSFWYQGNYKSFAHTFTTDEWYKQKKHTKPERVLEKNIPENNFVMTLEEMKLSPTHYMFLQYFRGCQIPTHTGTELSTIFGVAYQTVKNNLDEMQKLDIITLDKGPGKTTKVVIQEKWRQL